MNNRQFDFGSEVIVKGQTDVKGVVVGFNSTRNTYLLIVPVRHSTFLTTLAQATYSCKSNKEEHYELDDLDKYDDHSYTRWEKSENIAL